MNVVEFGLFDAGDPHDETFRCDICWSRPYEYRFAIDRCGGSIHNTSWGWEGIHVVFRDWLDSHYSDVTHSDLRGPVVWDITTPPPDLWVKRFDTVLSISTLEEVAGNHADIILENLLPQVRDGGRLVVTFDLPGFHLDEVSGALGAALKYPPFPLSPANSVNPTPGFPDKKRGDRWRCGYLVVTP